MVCIALGKQQNTENQKPSTLKNRPHERKFTLRQFIWILLEFWKIIDKVQLQKNGVTLQKSHLTRAGNLLLRIISSCYYSNSKIRSSSFFFSKLRQISSSISCMMKKKKKTNKIYRIQESLILCFIQLTICFCQ